MSKDSKESKDSKSTSGTASSTSVPIDRARTTAPTTQSASRRSTLRSATSDVKMSDSRSGSTVRLRQSSTSASAAVVPLPSNLPSDVSATLAAPPPRSRKSIAAQEREAAARQARAAAVAAGQPAERCARYKRPPSPRTRVSFGGSMTPEDRELCIKVLGGPSILQV